MAYSANPRAWLVFLGRVTYEEEAKALAEVYMNLWLFAA